MQVKHTRVLLMLILTVAAFLRFYHYGSWSLSNDELSALSRLRFDNFTDLIRFGVKESDFHPAGVEVFLWYWTRLFGNGVWVVRLPFVICGILSVYLIYLIGKRWFNESAGLLSAATFAVLQYPILYSQLARPYSPGLLFSLATVWFWTKIVFDDKRPFKDYAGFTLFAALAAYTHHYSFLFVVMVGLTGLFFLKGKQLWFYLLSGVAVAVLYLPHLNVFLYQFGIGGVGGEEGWLAKPGPHWIIGYVKYAVNGSWFSLSVLLLLGLFGFFISPVKRLTIFHKLALIWLILPFLIGYFYSVYRNPILQYSILLFSFPFAVLFLFSFYDENAVKVVRILVPGIMLLGTNQIVRSNRFYEQQHFGEFKDVAQKIAGWNAELGSDNVTNAIVVNSPFYIRYYLDKLDPQIEFAQYDNRGGKDFLELKKITDTSRTEYFIHAWTKPCPPEVNDIIRRKYPCVLRHVDYSELSAVTLFSKKPRDCRVPDPVPLARYANDFEHGLIWGGRPGNLDTTKYHSGKTSFAFDEHTEYGPALVLPVGAVHQGRFDRIRISVFVFSPEPLHDIPLVVSIVDQADENIVWSSSKIEDFTEPGRWDQAFFEFRVPKPLPPDSRIKIYIWNAEKTRFNIDDFVIEFY